MAEYIEREAAINEFDNQSQFYDAEWGNKRFTPDDVESIIRSIPAADVRPVVRGEWLEEINRTRSYKFVCSACCKTAYDPQPTRIVGWVKRCRYAFCPNCGAVMRRSRR